MKKFRAAFVLFLCFLTAVLMAAPVSAHGGHHGGRHHGSTAVSTVPGCGVRGCAVSGTHSHNCAYHPGQVCGGRCAALCTVKGCAAVGRHTHNGTVYCGYNHASGFCDSSHAGYGCHSC